MHDVIVVGAGIGDLCAAIPLASAGKRVLVLDGADEPGGKAGRATVEGVEVDTGPSVLTMTEAFDSVFRSAGTSLRDEVGLRELRPGFRYLYPDGVSLDVDHDLEQTLSNVRSALGPKEAEELRAFVDYAKQIWDTAAPVFVYGDAPNMKNVLGRGLGTLAKMTRIDPWSNMWASIEKRVRSPHLRKLLLRYATYNGSDARSAPATLNCIAYVELGLGGYGVEGGMFTLIHALRRVAERSGVEFRFGEMVRGIRLTDQRVTGVTLEGGRELAATQVVANADVAHLAESLLPRGSKHGLPVGLVPSMSGLNLIVRTARRPKGERAGHTVVFPEDYRREFADIFDRDQLPSDPTVYVCAQEVCHGRRGWEDDEPLFVMANAPPLRADGRGLEDSRYESVGDELIDRMQAAGLAAGGARAVWRRTPVELARRFPGSRGAIYGAASNGPTAAFQRPPNRVGKVPGLYLASGTAHPGGGMPLAALSGQSAARAVLADSPARKNTAHA
ncbi:MAG: phytoene desaturase family protein [Myxococcota bacterium]